MRVLGLLSYLKSATLVFLISLCLGYPGYAAEPVILQWDHSIDYPYLQSYKVYYYTTSGNKDSLIPADYAASCMLAVDLCPNAQGPITIGKDNTQITLNGLDASILYYFVVASVDQRGLEGEPTPEISLSSMTLTVSKAGTGAGTITSSPPGINCGTACSAGYIVNTVVTLTAAPDAGNTFTGWSGGCSGTGLTCNVTMDAIKSVTATFTPPRTLSVVKAGTGTGTVTGSPLGVSSDINCGTACSSDYTTNTVVTLTAVPDAGHVFTSWSGSWCSGTGLTCNVTMDAAKSVTATFTPLRTLGVQKEGTGTGTITGSPLGISSDINCGTACK
jgi:uncharacterized repeat protein (TIGR02543 family)